MNRSTFGDAVASKKASLANDIEEDDEDQEGNIKSYRGNFEGEEDEDGDEYNDAGDAIEPFNTKSDRKLGYFDENMNFVFKKGDEELDNWLGNLDESEMEQAIGEAAVAKKV